jgi:hypothetical protein
VRVNVRIKKEVEGKDEGQERGGMKEKNKI